MDEMENHIYIYRNLENRVQNLEAQLTPILFLPPPDPGTSHPEHQLVPFEIHNKLNFLDNYLKAEIAQSRAQDHDHHPHLYRIAHKVYMLQTAFRAWTQAMEPAASSTRSSIINEYDFGEDQEGEDSPVAEFTVYNNPVFAGENDGDYNSTEDDLLKSLKVQEFEWFKDEEDEVSCSDEAEKGEAKEEEEEEEEEDDDNGNDDYDYDDESHNKCCYRRIIGTMMVGMGMIFMMVGFPEYGDHHPHVYILTPT